MSRYLCRSRGLDHGLLRRTAPARNAPGSLARTTSLRSEGGRLVVGIGGTVVTSRPCPDSWTYHAARRITGSNNHKPMYFFMFLVRCSCACGVTTRDVPGCSAVFPHRREQPISGKGAVYPRNGLSLEAMTGTIPVGTCIQFAPLRPSYPQDLPGQDAGPDIPGMPSRGAGFSSRNDIVKQLRLMPMLTAAKTGSEGLG